MGILCATIVTSVYFDTLGSHHALHWHAIVYTAVDPMAVCTLIRDRAAGGYPHAMRHAMHEVIWQYHFSFHPLCTPLLGDEASVSPSYVCVCVDGI